VRLGAVTADGYQDQDTLVVPPEHETVDESLGLKSMDGRIAIHDLVVEYDDGTRASMRVPRVIEEGEVASIGPLARGRRVRAVHFRYDELRRGGPGARLEGFAR